MPRFPFPYQPRRPRRRTVGIVGAVALLIAAIAGSIGQCNGQQPAQRQQAPVSQHPAWERPDSGTQAPAAGNAASSASIPVHGGAAITDAVEVREIHRTLAAIRRGPPWPFPRADNEIYENWGSRLPQHERGYYHAFTVVTPDENDRGPRRLVIGKGGEVHFTRDHYKTFVRLDVPSPR